MSNNNHVLGGLLATLCLTSVVTATATAEQENELCPRFFALVIPRAIEDCRAARPDC